MSADETFELDETDRGILFLLQDDARNNTTEEIAEAVGVSSSTVSNRIRAMEEGGVIDGYGPYVSYDRADIPLHMLFICSVPSEDRVPIANEAINLHGIVNVREFLADTENLHIEIISETYTEMTEALDTVRDLGVTIDQTKMLHSIHYRPVDDIGAEVVEDTSE